MIYEFELGHNDMEATKNIHCAKGDGRVYQITVTRCYKKFTSGRKNIDEHERSVWPKRVDYEDILQAIEGYPAIIPPSVSGKRTISHVIAIRYFYVITKSVWTSRIVPHVINH